MCQGLPKVQIHATQLAKRLPHGATVIYDSDGLPLARDNGDFLVAVECQGLVMPDDDDNLKEQLPKVCQVCVDLLAQLGNFEQPKDKSFESETLNLIARLNIELSERKQQVMNLWERYSTLRDTNRKLQKRVEETEKMQLSVVTVGEEWLEQHNQQKQELEAALG